MGTISTSMQAVQQAQEDLEEVEELPPLGDDMVRKCIRDTSHLLSCTYYQYFILCLNVVNAHNLYFSLFQASKMWIQNKVDESKHDIHSQVDAIAAGTASVVNLTAGKTLALLNLIKLVRCFTTLTIQLYCKYK